VSPKLAGVAKLDLTALRGFIVEPVALQLAACDAALTPHSVRGFGVRIDPDDVLCVGLVDAQAPSLLRALRSSMRVAVNLTHPLSFVGRQVKGPVLEVAEPSTDAAEAAREYFVRFAKILGQIGLTPEQCRGMFCEGPTRWIRMRADDMFDQTPGAGAGAQLRA
jgi:hypothetical protein